jgi:hypothetical protein
MSQEVEEVEEGAVEEGEERDEGEGENLTAAQADACIPVLDAAHYVTCLQKRTARTTSRPGMGVRKKKGSRTSPISSLSKFTVLVGLLFVRSAFPS